MRPRRQNSDARPLQEGTDLDEMGFAALEIDDDAGNCPRVMLPLLAARQRRRGEDLAPQPLGQLPVGTRALVKLKSAGLLCQRRGGGPVVIARDRVDQDRPLRQCVEIDVPVRVEAILRDGWDRG